MYNQKARSLLQEFILERLFDSEKKIFFDGFNLLKVSFDDFLTQGYTLVKPTSEKLEFDFSNFNKVPAIQELEANEDSFSDEDKELLISFQNLFIRIRFIIMEYLIHQGMVQPAIEYADNSIDYFEKLQKRFHGTTIGVIESILPKIREERDRLIIRQNEFNETVKHKILWIKSYPELLDRLKKHESEKLIFKSNEITFEQLALSCFYIEHYSITSNFKLRFLKEEKYTVFFFQDLIKEHCINYNDLTPELLNKICKTCLNKKNEPYKVRQLQTLIGGLKA